MFNRSQLDEVVQQLMDAVPSSLRNLPEDLEKKFHAILQATFAKLDLVTREEFDAQVGVLQRTREKLEQLERTLRELEQQHKDSL